MTRIAALITATNSSAPVDTAAEPPNVAVVESNLFIKLATLICTIFSVVGLISVARCAWLRRGGGQSPANRSLNSKVVRSLPKFTYDSSSGGVSAECAICLAEYGDGDEVGVLPECGHFFHVRFVDTWLGSHSTCPSCRRILVASRCRKCAAESELKIGEDSVIVNSSSLA